MGGLLSAAQLALLGSIALICVFWLWCALLARRVTASVPRLASLDLPAPPRWPALSLVIPACNEADAIGPSTQARLRCDYPDLEVVLVDDRSTDATGAIMDALAAADPRVRVLHLRELPEGWLGKVHALDRGVAASRGEWLLLSDADVHFAPDTLRRAVAFAESRALDHLVALPRLWPAGLLRDAAVAAFGRLFTLATRLWAVSDPRSDASVGVGAFNLVRRSALERIGGLKRLRLAVGDDVELGRRLKRSGARQAAVNGCGTVELAWYTDLRSLARGLEKGLYAEGGRCEPWRLFVGAAVLLALDGGPWAALFSGRPWLVALGAVALLTGLVMTGVMARWAGVRLLPALLLPLGSVLIAWIIVRAAIVGWRRGGVLWRGTFYTDSLLREAMAQPD